MINASAVVVVVKKRKESEEAYICINLDRRAQSKDLDSFPALTGGGD